MPLQRFRLHQSGLQAQRICKAQSPFAMAHMHQLQLIRPRGNPLGQRPQQGQIGGPRPGSTSPANAQWAGCRRRHMLGNLGR